MSIRSYYILIISLIGCQTHTKTNNESLIPFSALHSFAYAFSRKSRQLITFRDETTNLGTSTLENVKIPRIFNNNFSKK